MLKRRSFISGIIGLATAPAIVRSSSLMQMPSRQIILLNDIPVGNYVLSYWTKGSNGAWEYHSRKVSEPKAVIDISGVQYIYNTQLEKLV